MARATKKTAKTATRKRKGKVGRPKGVKQSAAARKKISAALKAYWAGAGKKRRKKAPTKKSTARKSTARKSTARKGGKRTVRAKLHYRTKRKSYNVGTKRARKSSGKRPVAKRRPMA